MLKSIQRELIVQNPSYDIMQHVENEAIKLVSRAGEGSVTEIDLSMLNSWISKIKEKSIRAKYEKLVEKIIPIGMDHQIKRMTILMQMVAVDANLAMSYEMRALSEIMHALEGEELMYSFCEYLMHSASVIDQPRLACEQIDELQKQFKGLKDVTGDELKAKYFIFLDLYNSIINP